MKRHCWCKPLSRLGPFPCTIIPPGLFLQECDWFTRCRSAPHLGNMRSFLIILCATVSPAGFWLELWCSVPHIAEGQDGAHPNNLGRERRHKARVKRLQCKYWVVVAAPYLPRHLQGLGVVPAQKELEGGWLAWVLWGAVRHKPDGTGPNYFLKE